MRGFMRSMRSEVARRLVALTFAALVVTLAACGSDKSSSTGPTNVAGTYSLASIDGNSLPFSVPNNPHHTVVVQSATMTLGSDHSYTLAGTGTSDGGPSTQVVADAGTYAFSGSTVTFTSSSYAGLVYSGSATSSAITETVPGTFGGSTNTSFSLVFDKTS